MRKDKKKRLRRISGRKQERRAKRESLYVEGVFSSSRSGFGFVNVNDGEFEVFIPAKFVNDAIDRDLVKVELLAPDERTRDKGPAGRVVEVLERFRTSFVGEVLPGIRVKALDSRLPEEIRLFGSRRNAQVGDWVSVRLDSVEDGVCFGEIRKVIGKAGVVAADLDAVCEEYSIPPRYTGEENREAGQLQARDIFRIDRRNITSYAIDPVDAKDQDDAVSVQDCGNGKVILGVHISDVAAYIAPHSRFDQAAAKRTFSCYLPGRTLPMLPAELTAKLSLGNPSDNLVHTVFLTVDRSTGEVLSASREHSVMRGAVRLNYDEVQLFLDTRNEQNWSREQIRDIALLLDITAAMRRFRAAKEKFIDLPLPECRVMCDEVNNRILGIEKRLQRQAEQLVEECMLAANSAVGRELAEKGIPGLYRIHAAPAPEKIDEFTDLMMDNFGIVPGDITVRSNCINFIKSLPDDPRRPLILNMLLRSMPRAEYSAKRQEHFALGKMDYCHFTSPIRRYTDLAVHQQLWNCDCQTRTRSRHTFEQLAEHCTLQEENCDAAYYAASDRMKLRYLQTLLDAGDDTVYEAVISRVSSSGLQVDVGDIGVYGFVPAEVIDRHPENARRRRDEEYRIGSYIYLRLARIDFVRNSCIFVPAGRLL